MTDETKIKLMAAVKYGDTTEVREALKDIPRFYVVRSAEEDNILKQATTEAAEHGYTDILRILKDHGINLIENSSYLEAAIKSGNYHTVKYIANIAKHYGKVDIINDALEFAVNEQKFDIVHYLIKGCNADINRLTEKQYTQYQSFLGYDEDLQYLALEQACEHLGMDSHIVVIKSKKDCITDADKKAYSVIGKPFAVKRSYLNCNLLDTTFFYNNKGKATYTYCGYGDPYDSKDKLLAAFETADNLRQTMDEVLQELQEEKETDLDIERE